MFDPNIGLVWTKIQVSFLQFPPCVNQKRDDDDLYLDSNLCHNGEDSKKSPIWDPKKSPIWDPNKSV